MAEVASGCATDGTQVVLDTTVFVDLSIFVELPQALGISPDGQVKHRAEELITGQNKATVKLQSGEMRLPIDHSLYSLGGNPWNFAITRQVVVMALEIFGTPEHYFSNWELDIPSEIVSPAISSQLDRAKELGLLFRKDPVRGRLKKGLIILCSPNSQNPDEGNDLPEK